MIKPAPCVSSNGGVFAIYGAFINKSSYLIGSRMKENARTSGENKRKSVIVLMPDIRFQTRGNLYWGRILDAISKELDRQGLGMVILAEQPDNISGILNPEGFIGLIGVGLIPTSFMLEVHRLALPFVLIDHEDPLIPADTVFVNNYAGLVRITSHLIGLGHEAIRFIGDIDYSRSFFERWMGFRSVMEQHGLPIDMHHDLLHLSGHNRDEHAQEIKYWLQEQFDKRTSPTALVCANDAIAISALAALRELEWEVPKQISVSGFDNIEDAYDAVPPLTTINVPKEVLGRRAVETLLWRLQNPNDPFAKLLITGELIIRDSIARLNGQ